MFQTEERAYLGALNFVARLRNWKKPLVTEVREGEGKLNKITYVMRLVHSKFSVFTEILIVAVSLLALWMTYYFGIIHLMLKLVSESTDDFCDSPWTVCYKEAHPAAPEMPSLCLSGLPGSMSGHAGWPESGSLVSGPSKETTWHEAEEPCR